MRQIACITVLLLSSLCTSYAQDSSIKRIEVNISAQANIYFHEIVDTSKVICGAGIPPIEIDITGVTMIAFEDADGQVSCFGEYDSTYFGPDGGAYGAQTKVTARGAISGITHLKRTMFVTGVILSEFSSLEPPLPAEDFTGKEHYKDFRPQFNLPFFIGDGKTDKGINQRILPWKDATVLYLGFADALAGPAQNYCDNKGTIKMTVVLYYSDIGRN